MQEMASRQLTDLPDEVIQCILAYGGPGSALALGATCRRLNNVANEPLLWKYYCRSSFHRWDLSHDFEGKIRSAEYTGWKALFEQRIRVRCRTDALINEIINSPTGRIRKIEQIVNLGYDTKDTLLQRYLHAEESPNELALRYWSHVAMASMQRALAVPEWAPPKMNDLGFDSFERALGAFDLFILQGPAYGDVTEIFTQLSHYMHLIRDAHPKIDDMSPRRKATTVAEYLLNHGLVGIRDDRDYENLENNFLGLALHSPGGNCLPLISAVIYTLILRKLGLRASPCSLPFHVYVLVRPPPGLDLDGNACGDVPDPPHLFMDPFRNANEHSRSDLMSFLNSVSARPVQASAATRYLSAASVSNMTFRCAHNILGCLGSGRRTSFVQIKPIDVRAARYAAYWAIVLLNGHAPQHIPGPVLHQELLALMYESTENFPWDISLVEKYLLPRLARMPGYPEFERICRSVRLADDLPTHPRPRNMLVRYKIGQVFRHKRYRYTAVVTGWDSQCSMTEEWIVNNQVDRLPQGRDQGFYHSLEHNSTMRYVAEENIELFTPTEDDIAQFPIEIGKYFKRWDRESRIFVSNIRDEYPDD